MSKFTTSVPQNAIEDYLEVDDPIPGQNYACLSFITPERVLKRKESFKNAKFLEHIFTNDDRQTKEIREKLSSGDKSEFSYEKIHEMYEDWKYTRDQQLEEEFHKLQNFQTTVQGIKVRGVYSTEAEARIRAKKLQQKDKNFNVFVSSVGYWCPFDPNPEAVTDQVHQEEQLNTLAKEYFNNQSGKDELYEKMKQEQLDKARKELEERKKKLREETSMEVKETTQEDIKNVEELRKIVDESDAAFYKSAKDEAEKVKAESMTNLEQDDPWIQRKKQQEASKQSDESA